MKPDSALVELFPSYLADCGNNTFWLPFSPRFDRIHGNEPIYYCLVAFEVVFLLLSLVGIVLVLAIFARHQIVHVNLTALILFHGLLYCATILLRFYQMAFESHWIYLAEPACFPIPQLVIARSTAYISIVFLMMGVVMERALATHFVIDYENTKRVWISASIILLNFATSLMLSSQIVRGVINGVFCGIALLGPVFASVIIFRVLLARNVKRLGRLNDLIERQRNKFSTASRVSQDQYSLSLRLQLRENIWTMQKLYRMAQFVAPACVMCLPILALPAFLLQNKRQAWLLELIIEMTNLGIAIIGPLFAMYVIFVFDKVRNRVISKKWRRRFAKRSFRPVSVSIVKVSEADIHFNQMNSIFRQTLELKRQ